MVEPDEFVARGVLQFAGEAPRRDPRQRFGVGAPRFRRVGGKQPALHGPQAGRRQTLGARQHLPGRGFAKPPVGPGSGVEQDRNEREVDARPRLLGDAGAGRHQRRAIDAAC